MTAFGSELLQNLQGTVVERHRADPFGLRGLGRNAPHPSGPVDVHPPGSECLGELAWKSYVSIREQEEPDYCRKEFSKRRPSDLRIPDLVGKRFSWRGAVVIPMIHPSGSANGARAHYQVQDQESKVLLGHEIERLHLHDVHS